MQVCNIQICMKIALNTHLEFLERKVLRKMKIGIDLGGSHIAIGVIDSNGVVEEKVEKRLMQPEKDNIKKFIEDYITENVEKMREKYEISGIGISVPGTVNEKSIIKSVNLNLKDYNIVECLEQKIKLPIHIRNDAKSAAIAENRFGCLKNYDRAVFLTLGTGIGGAVIINNQLLNTGDLPGCEFGHMVIEKDGIICSCGKKGCFEKYASMKVLKTNLRNALNLDETTRGQELIEIFRSLDKESQDYIKVEKVIDTYIEYLSIGISNIINIFEPEVIGIGGSFVYFEEILLHRLKNKLLEEHLLFNPRQIPIQTALLGNDAGIIAWA